MCVLCLDNVTGVTQLHDVVYVLCWQSSTIMRFSATTHQRLTDMDVLDLRRPEDIATCERTSRLYVADWDSVWRVSPDGADIRHWRPDCRYDPMKEVKVDVTDRSLSVTSTRLLVTSRHARQLRQFDTDGDELRRVQIPRHMEPRLSLIHI